MSSYAQTAYDAANAAMPGENPDLIRLYTLLALVKGEDTTLEDVHDAWSLWRAHTSPDHPSIVPFAELEPHIQAYDVPYRDGIHAAADEIKETT